MFNLSDSGYVFHFQVDGDKVLVEGLPENWDNFANIVTFFADIVTFWEMSPYINLTCFQNL